MCGIAGIFLKDAIEAPSEILLSDMIHTIKHRGPDAQKVWTSNGVGLGHARLSIIDLHASSDQPMLDPETGNIIVFNGEIYNYIELRNDLQLLGHKFATQSDTEVILKAYVEWGVNCLNKFNGMWAFALYDQKEKTLFCARDRFGVKPFTYGITTKNELVFASEAKAITTHFPEFRQVNIEFLLNFVERDFFACYKETFYKKIFNLLPGHYFVIKNGELPQQHRYWSWTPEINPVKKRDAEIISEFKELLIDSIRLRFRSDVPVGACLSGGLDSGTVVGLASQLYDKRLHTFSCVFPNTPEFDESSYIDASVKKFNTIPSYSEPSHDNFIDSMYLSVFEQDGPTGGPSILSQRSVMELASKDVKVVLDGQGADEVLGGYHGYFHYSLMTHARAFGKKKSLSNLYRYVSNASKIKKRSGSKVGSLSQFLDLTSTPPKFNTGNIKETQLGYFTEFEGDDLNSLLLEHVFTNLSNLLHYEDRNSMRFSIESRLPFLDYRLVELAFSLPHQYKVRGSTTKWLLHNVARDVLPHKVLHRKDKMGFTTPSHKWFLEGDNVKFFEQYFNDDNYIYKSISPYMREFLLSSFNSLSAPQNHTPAAGGNFNALWRFFTANMWLESLN